MNPNLIQPEGGAGSWRDFEECFDSTGVAISDNAPGPGLNPACEPEIVLTIDVWE